MSATTSVKAALVPAASPASALSCSASAFCFRSSAFSATAAFPAGSAFAGAATAIVRYDFEENHAVGQDDHSDGVVYQYTEPEVTRVEEAPGHMEFDHETGLLYVADTGGGRVLWLDTTTGEEGEKLRQRQEQIRTYSSWEGADWGVLVEGLEQPGGLALDGEGHLFVGEFATGVLHAYDLKGNELHSLDTKWGGDALYGVEIGPDGALWAVNHAKPAVYRLRASQGD